MSIRKSGISGVSTNPALTFCTLVVFQGNSVGWNLKEIWLSTPIFCESDFGKISLFSSLNALIFPSPEPQTTDFQLKINFRHALNIFSRSPD